MARDFPGCPFERYADDGVVHCKSRRQAEYVLAGIAARMQRLGSGCTPTRRGSSTARTATVGASTSTPPSPSSGSPSGHGRRSSKNGEYFTSFLPAISPEALKAKSAELREMRIHRRTDLSLDDLARWLNPIVAGWMNYYGRYYRPRWIPSCSASTPT